MQRRNILLGSAGLALVGQAIAPRTALAQGAVRMLSPTEHLAMTLMGGTLAKQTSELAAVRAQHPRVKEFAGFEVAEQTVVAQVLTDTANPPPVPLDADHAAVLQALQAHNGPNFDRAYVLAQLQGHRELRDVQQAYLNNPNRSTDRQHIAMMALMSINQHLALLTDLQSITG